MKLILGSRRRRCLARVSVFLVTVALIVGMVGCDGSGDGGDYNPPPSENLEIRTWYDLAAVRDNLAGNHTLMNDLDSTTHGYEELASPMANQGKGWQPIGAITQGDGMRFTGTLDGQGYEICDLFINRPGAYGVGFVGVVGQEGVVENIGVVNVTVTGDECVGGLVGYSCGTVSNSYSSGSVTGYAYVGGLVGQTHEGTVSNSYSSANVTGEYSIGGLVGFNDGIVSNSYSTGNVTGNEYVGGLVGQNHEGTVSNSFWDIQTSGQATSAGGTGKNTTEMHDIITFSDAGWNITAVAMNETNPAYIWNIVNNVTYPFLSWEP
jgi:hypothetical protein